MDKVFSVDDIVGHFWSPPPIPLPIHDDSVSESNATNSSLLSSFTMNRSHSEWEFQRFLQEAASVCKDNNESTSASRSSISCTISGNPVIVNDEIKDDYKLNNAKFDVNIVGNNNKSDREGEGFLGGIAQPPIDSEEYQAFLKSRLHLACAAVALTRVNYVEPKESAVGVVPDNESPSSNTSQVGVGSPGAPPAKYVPKKQDITQDKVAGKPLRVNSLPVPQKLSVIPVRSTTTGSSRDDSDEDEVEGETETSQNMYPTDAKHVRRMLSNRESARRSRRRKQAHLTDIETQVSQLRVDNSSLLKRLSDISQKYNEAAVDNRVLKADVETLRAKVKMAEETVKRLTGLNPFFQAMSEISTIVMPSFAASPSDTSANAAIPVEEEQKQHHHQAPASNHPSTHAQRIQSDISNIHRVDGVHQSLATAAGAEKKLGRTTSMQRVASLEHLQKRIRGELGSCRNH